MGGYVIAKHHVLGYSVSNYTLKIEILKPVTTNDKKTDFNRLTYLHIIKCRKPFRRTVRRYNLLCAFPREYFNMIFSGVFTGLTSRNNNNIKFRSKRK